MTAAVRTGLAVLVLVGAASAGQALSAPDLVRRGNSALKAGNYDDALKAYREAEVDRPEAAELKYNQGLVYYRRRDFAKARDLFAKALSARDLPLEAKAHFNLGNCAYSQALEKLKSYDEAIRLAREAVGFYRQALDLMPDDKEARANIETAQLLIKDLQDRKKKEEEEKKKSQSQPSSQPQSQPSSQPQSQPQSQPSSQPQSQPQKQEGENHEKQEEQQRHDPGQDEQHQPQKQGEQPQMSPEQADRLLQAIRDKERQRRSDEARRQAIGRIMVDKDW